jgi:hypothetical protein
MPARHTSLKGRFASRSGFQSRRLWSTKEGVGETSGQTAGSSFRGARSSKTGPAEETVFLRSVRIFDPQFHRALAPAVKSGPDVFADALVPGPPGFWSSPLSPALRSPYIFKIRLCYLRPHLACGAGGCRRAARLRRMVIVCRNGRVNRISG